MERSWLKYMKRSLVSKMMNNENQSPSVLLLDFAQQTNFGDDIMQRALISLSKKYLSSNISASSYYGYNEFELARKDFSSYSENFNLDVIGGFSATYFKNRSSNKLFSVAKRLLFLFNCFLYLVSIKLGFGSIVSKVFFSKDKREVLQRIIDADIVVWNGRNFRGSSTSKLAELIKILELCVNPLVCIFLGKKIYSVGSSIWPLQSPVSKAVMKFVINNSTSFWAREKATESYMRSELSIESGVVKKMPDLSFYVLNQVVSETDKFIRDLDSNVIALTIVGRKEFLTDDIHQQYLHAMSKFVDAAHQLGYSIRVIPQVTYEEEPYDYELNYLLSKNKDADIEVAAHGNSVEYLLSEYCKCKLLVASRMHSAIFASSCGLPVTAITYDSGAKWSILDDLNISRELVMDSTNIDTEKFIDNFKTCLALSEKHEGKNSSIPVLSGGVENIFKFIRDDYEGKKNNVTI